MSPGLERRQAAHRPRLTDQGGFTLVEVLVAFTVLSILLSVLFRGVVTMRSGSLTFEDQTTKQTIARTVFEGALAKRDLVNGRYTGVRNGIRWTLVAKPIDLSRQLPPPEDDGVEPGASPPLAQQQTGSVGVTVASARDNDKPTWSLQRLTVRIEHAGRPIEVETIRLVKPESKE